MDVVTETGGWEKDFGEPCPELQHCLCTGTEFHVDVLPGLGYGLTELPHLTHGNGILSPQLAASREASCHEKIGQYVSCIENLPLPSCVGY